jgi:copper transport protein
VRARWLLLAFALAAAVFVVTVPARSVEAHALLVRADPPANSQLREPPTVLTLYFSEPIERAFTSARVVDQDNRRVDDRVEFDDADEALMRVYLKDVTPGYITVDWQNVSKVDGHRLTGSYPISILNPDGSVAATPPAATGSTTSGESPKPLRVVSKALLLIAGSVLVGGAAFLAIVAPGAGRPETRIEFEHKAWLVIGGALIAMAIGGLAELALQASNVNAGVAEVLETRWGERWLLRHATLLLPALALLVAWNSPRPQRLMSFVALAGGVVYLLSTSSVSHGAAGGGAFWATLSDFFHLLASSVWIGMLALLILYFRWAKTAYKDGERYLVLASALRRFSLIAVVSVSSLLFTGVVNSLVEVGRPVDLLDTGYGRALLVKLLLLIPLLAIGARNAYLLRPQLVQEAGERQIRSRQELLAETETELNKTMRWELGVALAVLAVVALLVQITPTRGRIAEASAPGPFVQTAEAENLFVTLRVDPNQAGVNTFEVYLAGDTSTVESLRLEFVQPGGFGSPARLTLEPSNPPTFYLGEGPYLTEPGEWTITLNVRRSAGFDLRLDFQDEVQSAAPVAVGARLGGDYDSPVKFTAAAVGLLAFAAAGAGVLLIASLPRSGFPDGYMAWAFEEASYRLPVARLRPLISLGLLVAFGIALGLIVGRHFDNKPLSGDAATEGNPVEATQASIDRGRMLFTNNCVQCHGETGRGDGPLAASLPIQPANLYLHVPFHPDQFFFGVMTKGLSGVMPSFESSISEEDRWNILNFLRAQFGNPDPATQ